ncbi:MAG: hypothetical protein BJ554DRAFT_2223 [Olpidium bornovanus]|uniref:Uncharacterized protein n=1 Tax=Olpidium bornovanus TaxID=278681 RepID=A0A8H8A1M7_9FUNG|nr:MAG: hypothetical protein BJ554DRAFT_2223 [Olpidium bornovanus]
MPRRQIDRADEHADPAPPRAAEHQRCEGGGRAGAGFLRRSWVANRAYARKSAFRRSSSSSFPVRPEFFLLHIDPAKVGEENSRREGVERKNGLISNEGSEWRKNPIRPPSCLHPGPPAKPPECKGSLAFIPADRFPPPTPPLVR